MRWLALTLGAALLASPGFAARGGDLGTTSDSTANSSTLFGTGGVARPGGRDTAGNPISGYPAVPTGQEAFDGSRTAAERNAYDPDSWVTEILRGSSLRQREGQPFRPSVNRVVGTQINNTSRVANHMASQGNFGGEGGGSSWTDLARVLTQIFNGWDA
jgi:hypothetical protein